MTPADRTKLIDEAGRLAEELDRADTAHDAATAGKRSRLDEIRAMVPSWYPKLKPSVALSVPGNKYVAVISERGNRSSIISVAKVIARLGKAEAEKWISIPLGELRKLLPKHEHSEYILTERIGERSVEFVAKAKKAA